MKPVFAVHHDPVTDSQVLTIRDSKGGVSRLSYEEACDLMRFLADQSEVAIILRRTGRPL